MISTRVPAWCEQRTVTSADGRYTVACYYTRDGHPVSKARAERVEITEYAPDGTPLRLQEGTVDTVAREQDDEVVFAPAPFRFSR